MSSAFLRRLGIALGVLLIIWLGASVFRRSSRDAAKAFAPTKVDQASVDSVLIQQPSETIRLAKNGSRWTVNGMPAGSSTVQELLTAVADTGSKGEVIAESKTSHERLGVDSTSGRLLTIKQGSKTLASYWIGKRGPNYESAYVRIPGQNAVYQVKGRLVEYVERKADDWRDKQITAIEGDSLTSVEIQRGGQSYTLTKSGKDWTLGGAPADSGAVASLLSQFKRLEANGFASPAEADSAQFDRPDRLIRLAGAGGRPLAQLALDSASSGFWVKRDTSSTVYRIDQWTANQITPADSTLRKK
jgi:hypothetical protein